MDPRQVTEETRSHAAHGPIGITLNHEYQVSKLDRQSVLLSERADSITMSSGKPNIFLMSERAAFRNAEIIRARQVKNVTARVAWRKYLKRVVVRVPPMKQCRLRLTQPSITTRCSRQLAS